MTVPFDFDEVGLAKLLALPGNVRMRHDVDVLPDAALSMARFEHGLGVSAMYHLLPDGPFYIPTRELTDELRELGHSVCLHADLHLRRDEKIGDEDARARIWRAFQQLEEQIGPVDIAFRSIHAPPRHAMWREFGLWPGTMASGPRWRGRYVSDSGGRFRFKDPLSRTARPLQLNLHPEWWPPYGHSSMRDVKYDHPAKWAELFDR